MTGLTDVGAKGLQLRGKCVMIDSRSDMRREWVLLPGGQKSKQKLWQGLQK